MPGCWAGWGHCGGLAGVLALPSLGGQRDLWFGGLWLARAGWLAGRQGRVPGRPGIWLVGRVSGWRLAVQAEEGLAGQGAQGAGRGLATLPCPGYRFLDEGLLGLAQFWI